MLSIKDPFLCQEGFSFFSLPSFPTLGFPQGLPFLCQIVPSVKGQIIKNKFFKEPCPSLYLEASATERIHNLSAA
jgi:hypothetical protein